MISAISYTQEEQEKINKFKLLPDEEMRGHWENTHDGELSDLKERIKGYYLKVQDYTCPYCRQRIEVKNKAAWDAEHIIPKDSHPRFMFDAENLCIACKDCNLAKLNQNVLVDKNRKTFPRDSKSYLISHPHFDDYETDIKIIALAAFYLPKSDKGRKTVEICGLLRFLYKFADYDCASKDVDERIGALSAELMEAKDGMQRHFLLSAISTIALDGARAQMEQAMAQRFEHSASSTVQCD
jgi:5-methylcytosine-specific restriction endonuclease McrA